MIDNALHQVRWADFKSRAAYSARITYSARPPGFVRLITGYRHAIIQAQHISLLDYLRLRQLMSGAWIHSFAPSIAAFVARFAIFSNAAMYSGRQSG